MALIDPVPTTKASLGALASETVFQCKRGLVGLTTDGGTGEDFHVLHPGDRVQIGSGVTVEYIGYSGSPLGDALHHMVAA